MCGIFGVVGFRKSEITHAREALHSLEHRGPDQWGEWYDDQVYLGHRRLSIIDLSENARQPMVDERNGVVIAVNGEIYNYRELRRELERETPFFSQSDSEVVLHGYSAWGMEKLLERLDGMYAFVLYDSRNRRLYLVRDRFGKKPLFYTFLGNRLIFASEIKALFRFQPELRRFSWEGVKNWIYFRGNLTPDTIYNNVPKLLPGHFLRRENGNWSLHSYYDILDAISPGAENPASQEELRQYLDVAVQKRLMSDVPVGLQLSGGVDSSLVAYFVKQHHQGAMHTFSVGFNDPHLQEFSEEPYARYVAQKLGFQHHQINISQADYQENFQHTVYLFDGMLDYPNAVAIYLLSKHSKRFITVALTGEGADELFGGYTKFRSMLKLAQSSSRGFFPEGLLRGWLGRFWRSYWRSRYLRWRYGGRPRQILTDLNCYIAPDTFHQIFGDPGIQPLEVVNDERLQALPFYRQLLVMDHKTYLFSLLDRQDRASMGAAIESRLPFLDRQLVEWVLQLKQEYLFDLMENKKILKQLASEIFGPRFTYRRKMGFPIPIQHWLAPNGLLGGQVQRALSRDFVLMERINRSALHSYLEGNGFDRKLLNYPDSDRMWLKWFLVVLRTAQDVMNITDVV